VKEIAERHGHKVLFTPPYHSDLQPIELLWAYVKGNIGRQYSFDTTFEDVRARLIEEFEALRAKSQLVYKIINHVDKALAVYCKADEEATETVSINVAADQSAPGDEEDEDDALSFITCSGGSDSESQGDAASCDESCYSDYVSDCSDEFTEYSDSDSSDDSDV
jgi:hypothetical protein